MSNVERCSPDTDQDTEILMWLNAVELDTIENARELLTRAVRPASANIEPLFLPVAESERTIAIVALIKAGQVPTPVATEYRLRELLPRESTDERRCQNARAATDWSSVIDDFGQELARQVSQHWKSNGEGPTRTEILRSSPTMEFVSSRGLSAHHDRYIQGPVMFELIRAGWLCCSKQPRSLCAGPTAYAYQRGNNTRISSTNVGRIVGRSVGVFRYQHHRGPTWDELAECARDNRGHRVFVDASDAEAQSAWLLAEQWVRIEAGELKRGAATKMYARRRREARKNGRQSLT